MKTLEESTNPEKWPHEKVGSIECRKRDLIIRIADWTRTKEEPAFDVEVYVGGVYDWNLSKTFSMSEGATKQQAKQGAIAFAQKKITELL